jgi:hypothetical protein
MDATIRGCESGCKGSFWQDRTVKKWNVERFTRKEYSNTTIKKSIKEISIPLSHIDPRKWLVISIQLPLRSPCAILVDADTSAPRRE